MDMNTPLSPEKSKELRNKHPLYSRMSGEVVWLLFEEQGYTQEQCGEMMDTTLETMHSVLKIMAELEADPKKFLAFTHTGENGCDICHAFAHKAIAVTTTGWEKQVPPFAVGCTLTCSALNAAEVERENYTLLAAEKLPPNTCSLLCPAQMAKK